MISVIVPVYNVEAYLRRCLDSILNQTCRDFELLLVDDGSTDCSGRICEEYAQKDGRIEVFHKANGGISSARNLGLNNATGDYISFIDSDDWVEPDFLEVLLRLLLANNADISQCFYIKETSKIRDENLPVIRTDSSEIFEGRETLHNLFDKRMSFRTVLAWNKLYKRRLFESLRFPEGIIFEDEAFTHEVLYQSDKLVVNDSTLYHYTWRADSLSNSKQSFKYLDLVGAVERRVAFFEARREEEFLLRTMAKYSEVLLKVGAAVCFSDAENGQQYLQEIRQKLDGNLEAFRQNKYMRKEYLLLLKLYEASPWLGFKAYKNLSAAKEVYKELRR